MNLATDVRGTGRAVDTFADLHDRGRTPSTGWYRSRIPTALPQAHQQFAFAVDLDACTGCKACVVACHSMNGLDEDELWRSVGVLHSVSDTVNVDSGTPEQRTVTTACHHCSDPACLNGCPVNAYEKDIITGAVIHLDDQCIGCSYCTMTCPYEVPVFNERLGIVRKCDMCHDRLKAGESPACVQGCPNGAITIEVVDRNQQVSRLVTRSLVAGAPQSWLTSPTTTYITKLAPLALEQVDELHASPAASHSPLVAMLVLTQVAVGLSLSEVLLGSRITSALAMCLAIVGIAASAAHLGRPLQAWRVVLGIGHSWLSREAVALGAYVGLSAVHVLVPSRVIAVVAAVAGMFAVFTSVKVYSVTHRQMWSTLRTSGRFGSIVGMAALLAVASTTSNEEVRMRMIIVALIVIAVCGATRVTRIYRYRSSSSVSLKRTAKLLSGELRAINQCQLAATISAIVLLAVGVVTLSTILVLSACLAVTIASVCERTLFFRAVSPDRMPT